MSFSDNIARMRNEHNLTDICKIFVIWWHVWFAQNKVVFLEERKVPSKVATAVVGFFCDSYHANNIEDMLSVSTPKAPSNSKK